MSAPALTPFRQHAKDLDDIDAEITADLFGPRTAAATHSSQRAASTPATAFPEPAPVRERGSGAAVRR
ncbi:hypothetical protein ACFV6F_08860 [Kitasatospora phosalacinea]|uniref:hypothetical protein n=1 Tax=Kitasatospora phosalacinea TaxID=2065 RepID=UPI00365292C2